MKIANCVWRNNTVPSIPPKNKTLAVAIKIYTKKYIKVFWPSPVLIDFLTLFQLLRPKL